MELSREKRLQRKPCLCILSNIDDDDVVMHDVDCSYCDGGFLETASLEDNEFDSGSCLTFDDVESTAEEGSDIKFRTEENVTVRYQEVNDEEFNVKREVLLNKEAQLDKFIAVLQRNNARILQRFNEVQEDKKWAERKDEEWKGKRRTVSLSVRFSPQSGHRSVSLVGKESKKNNRKR